MRINCVQIQNYNNRSIPRTFPKVSFGRKIVNPLNGMSKSTQESLCNLLASENLKEVKMTFIEACKILEGLGCKIVRTTGSHARAHKDGSERVCTIVDPHNQSGKILPVKELNKIRKFITLVLNK